MKQSLLPQVKMEFKKTDDGKLVVEFDSVPKLLVVSLNGYGTDDRLLINGEIVEFARDIVIKSPFNEATTHTVEYVTMLCGRESDFKKECIKL